MKMSQNKKELEEAYTHCRIGEYTRAERALVWKEARTTLLSRARTSYRTLLSNPEDSVHDLLKKVMTQLDSTKENKTFWQMPDFGRFLNYLTTSLRNAGLSEKSVRQHVNQTSLPRVPTGDTKDCIDVPDDDGRGIRTRLIDEERLGLIRQGLHEMVRLGLITADERDICIRRKVDKWSRSRIKEVFGLKEDKDVSTTWTKVQPKMKDYFKKSLGVDSRLMTR